VVGLEALAVPHLVEETGKLDLDAADHRRELLRLGQPEQRQGAVCFDLEDPLDERAGLRRR